MTNQPIHSFHIPVMGLAYTIDSPIRVAQYGISSVISIIDDEIIEKIKNFYNSKFNLNYPEISLKSHDFRAKRITDYLNLVDDIVALKFETFKKELTEDKTVLKKFTEMLPDTSELRKSMQDFLNKKSVPATDLKDFIDAALVPGDIDVNIIMTKVDKDNFHNNEQLPVQYNDAHASLRGFANSRLRSSVVLSAGMNPRLYSYIEEFEDFFPDKNNVLKKKIILKVSDFRSAMIQGSFLAKKGLWVSEYRVESGLNCGGHAFATEGLLMGPIMEEFRQRKDELVIPAHRLMVSALAQKGKKIPENPLEMKITVQGGVGTEEEHRFLLNHYKADSVGWGSPFLLVPEATSMDDETRILLCRSEEKDFYLSNISPLGIPFNTVRGTTNEMIKLSKEKENKYGSSCPKKLLALSKEFSPTGMCTASKKYQDIKLSQLKSEKQQISEKQWTKRKLAITDKSCLCVGLVNASYIENNIKIKGEKQGVVVCPGPNMAYFRQEASLSEMVQHIYGANDLLYGRQRPNMFINELKIYANYLKNEIADFSELLTKNQVKKWMTFQANLLEGVSYYKSLFISSEYFKKERTGNLKLLEDYKKLISEIEIPVVEQVLA